MSNWIINLFFQYKYCNLPIVCKDTGAIEKPSVTVREIFW